MSSNINANGSVRLNHKKRPSPTPDQSKAPVPTSSTTQIVDNSDKTPVMVGIDPSCSTKKNKLRPWDRPVLNSAKVREILRATQQVSSTVRTVGDLVQKPVLIGIIGCTSAGKSTLCARILERRLSPIDKSACTALCVRQIVVRKAKPDDDDYQLVIPRRAPPKDEKAPRPGLLERAAQALRPQLAVPSPALSTNTSAAIIERLDAEFKDILGAAGSDGKPVFDLSAAAVIKIADNDAWPIEIVDTPGPRNNNKDTEILETYKNIGTLVLPIRYQADITDGVVVRLLTNNCDELQRAGVRVFVVITHIDGATDLQKKATDQKELDSFVRDIGKLRNDLKGILAGFAIVQCIDPEKPYAAGDVHSSAEKLTLEGLSEDLLKFEDEIIWGIDQFRNEIVKMQVGQWSEGTLATTQRSLDGEIDKRSKKIRYLKAGTIPSEEAGAILATLSENTQIRMECEEALKTVAFEHVVAYTTSIMGEVPESAVKLTKSIWGHMYIEMSGVDKLYADQKVARGLATRISASLADRIAPALSAAAENYARFLTQSISDYLEKSPRLHDEIMVLWRRFIGEKKELIAAYLEQSVKDHSVMVYQNDDDVRETTKKLVSPPTNRLVFPPCAFSEAQNTNNIIRMAVRLLEGILYIILGDIIAAFTARVICGFPRFLVGQLGEMNEKWKGADDSEIADLEAQLAPFAEAAKTLKEIVANIGTLQKTE